MGRYIELWLRFLHDLGLVAWVKDGALDIVIAGAGLFF